MSAKQKLLTFLSKAEGRNTFSVAQARSMFGIENVSARIYELRNEGFPIYTNVRHRADGTPVCVYQLGKASKSFKQFCKSRGIKVQKVAA
ncbi:MAG TPA: helix-turn-helix domain-containing protein [Candidatus Nitrosopolaris rasttigaisensis]|nr:helix-turn-helix domain-containing protein [Candidatus Nitrosopolaris rasttigaisensis]